MGLRFLNGFKFEIRTIEFRTNSETRILNDDFAIRTSDSAFMPTADFGLWTLDSITGNRCVFFKFTAAISAGDNRGFSAGFSANGFFFERSEERRVGKECRSRW